ncbi:unnamed protein product, partial [Meganyctiphanes norvegica]
GYSRDLDAFRQLLLVRSWCPDRTISQAARYIKSALGDEYADSVILDLEATWDEADNRTPLVCFLSVGSDPSSQIEALAKAKEMEFCFISMGQGQEEHARKLLMTAIAQGRWLLLQNCHLSLEFCTELLQVVTETEQMHPQFRLWISTEVHPLFPISFLQ